MFGGQHFDGVLIAVWGRHFGPSRERERVCVSTQECVGGEKKHQLIRRLPASPVRPSGRSGIRLKVCGNKRSKL